MQVGLRDDRLDLSDLIAEYCNTLGKTKHAGYVFQSLTRVAHCLGWSELGDIKWHLVESTIKALTHDGKPVSNRTQAFYLGEWKAFTRWLRVVRRVISVGPLEGISKPNPEKDRRLIRRYLNLGEFTYLRLPPCVLLFEAAIQTGYRASELWALAPSSLAGTTLTLAAKYKKNRQAATQYVTLELAKRPIGSLFVGVRVRTSEILRDDLTVCRWQAANDSDAIDDLLLPVDSQGRTLDFHAFRHTCGAWLAMSGRQPNVVQSIMRPSIITRTLDTNGHLFSGAEADAVQAFRRYFAKS